MADKTTEFLILNGERVASEDMKRFWAERPDPDFSPEHNAEVIRRSIERAEKHRLEMRKMQMEGIRERASALASYIKYQDRGGNKSAENYFGRKEMTRLQGKKVIQMLQRAKETGQPYWKVISNHKVQGYK